MLGEHHDLLSELPEHRDTILNLKVSNAHFAGLFDAYHKLDGDVRRAEERIEPTSDFHEEEMKKERLKLMDEMVAMILEAEKARG